jgi:TolB-like protein/tetratricopeptide (TPR) repeat protein
MAEDLRSIGPGGAVEQPRYARAITRVAVLPFRLLRHDPDIEFVCFSLPDAIATTLASLETLVVRSPLAAGAPADLAAIARDAKVDVVVAGTVLRAGDVVRVSTQLLEASTGKILSSHATQRPANDLFETEDAIVREVVESMAGPLAGREHRAIRPDVPANAKAYEFYLRANALSHEPSGWAIARDLYVQAVQADADYAPAWARLGRVYRLLAKYAPVYSRSLKSAQRAEQAALAESAFNRALTLNPALSIADAYYAQLELDLGRAAAATVRLLRRAALRGTDPDLFAALVSTCRYCGLLDASFSAADLAQRLDPDVRTSVTHTFFMAGDYLQAAAESEQRWQPGNFGGVALLAAGHPEARARLVLDFERYGGEEIALAFVNGDVARALGATDRILPVFPDPEFHFYWALLLAHLGELDRALDVLAGAIEGGFFPLATLHRHQWLDAARDRAEFHAIVRRARHRHEDAARAFVEAEGPRLLGVTPVVLNS